MLPELQWRLIIPGNPIPKARARSGKGKRHHTPIRTREFERYCKTLALANRPHAWALGLRYVLYVHFFRKDRTRCDGSNLQKSIEDSLNEVAWNDDSQIIEWHGKISVDRDNPRTEILVMVANDM